MQWRRNIKLHSDIINIENDKEKLNNDNLDTEETQAEVANK